MIKRELLKKKIKQTDTTNNEAEHEINASFKPLFSGRLRTRGLSICTSDLQLNPPKAFWIL